MYMIPSGIGLPIPTFPVSGRKYRYDLYVFIPLIFE
jgi:hypothetical protein